jgi:hypothetical protein
VLRAKGVTLKKKKTKGKGEIIWVLPLLIFYVGLNFFTLTLEQVESRCINTIGKLMNRSLS